MDRRKAAHGRAEESDWVRRFLPLAPPGSRVLDLAAGAGRHTRFALSLGCAVTAADRDLSGLSDLAGNPQVALESVDLEQEAPWPFLTGAYGAVIVTNYLHRPSLGRLPGLLAPGGVLIYETFAVGNERFGRPRNPDYLLRPGELLDAFSDRLAIVAYENGRLDREGGPAMIQRIAALNDEIGPSTRL